MILLTRFFVAVMAMAVVVAASNFLVQFPVHGNLGAMDLANVLTWGAFTYPFAFLVTDLTNRYFGPRGARLVVLVGFTIAVVLSVALASPRIAIASGAAFLTAQLLDITIFDRLRAGVWWRAPLLSSLGGSILDTMLFFGIAFSAQFSVLDTGLGREDGSLSFLVPLLDQGSEVPLWISLALGDFVVKTLVALFLLAPYGLLRGRVADRVVHPSAP